MTCYYFWNIQLENRKPKQHNQEQSRGPTVSEHVGLHAQALFMHGTAQGRSAASDPRACRHSISWDRLLFPHARLHACLTADGKVIDPI